MAEGYKSKEEMFEEMGEGRPIPLSAIAKGRSAAEISEMYEEAVMDAAKVSAAYGDSEEEQFMFAIKAAAYSLYLLGVEDGMKP